MVSITVNKESTYRFLIGLIAILLLVHDIDAQEKKIDPNGYNRFYYDSGVLSSEGNLRNGQPEGYWKNYYESGVLKSEGNRIGHALDSIWKFYSEAGILIEEIRYKEGKRNGLTKRYSNEGFLISSTPYVDDIRQGIGFTYYSNGAVKTETPYENGAENGRSFEFDEKGQIITITTYKNGIFINQEKINRKNSEGEREDKWKEFYEDRTVKAEGRYSNGRKDGYWKEFESDGELRVTSKFANGKMITDAEELADLEVEEVFYPDSDGKIKFRGTYLLGKAHGTHIWYAISGDIDSTKVYRKGNLIAEGDMTTDGLRIGQWKEYHQPMGELKAVGDYKEGFREGLWTYYFTNGQIEQKGKYNAKGKPTGKWVWYYENGNLLREETFENGLEDGWLIEYSDTGKVITKGEYIDGLEEGEWFIEVGDHHEEGNYEAGMKQGVWKHYYLSSGKLRFEGSYFDDLPQDKHVWYYDNGVKMLDGKFVSGVKEGEWRRYNRDGSVFVTIEYSSGNEIKVDGVKLKVKGSED